MKKRIVSLLLALCLLAGLLPAVTPQADAVISTVIGTSLKMCTSLVKGGIYACRNGSEYDNAGQGVLAVFKYAGSDLLDRAVPAACPCGKGARPALLFGRAFGGAGQAAAPARGCGRVRAPCSKPAIFSAARNPRGVFHGRMPLKSPPCERKMQRHSLRSRRRLCRLRLSKNPPGRKFRREG